MPKISALGFLVGDLQKMAQESLQKVHVVRLERTLAELQDQFGTTERRRHQQGIFVTTDAMENQFKSRKGYKHHSPSYSFLQPFGSCELNELDN